MLIRLALLSAYSTAYLPSANTINPIVIALVGRLIQIAAALLGMTIAWSFFEGMIGHITDNPSLVQNIWPRILAAVLCLLLAVFAIPISNAVFDAFSGIFTP